MIVLVKCGSQLVFNNDVIMIWGKIPADVNTVNFALSCNPMIVVTSSIMSTSVSTTATVGYVSGCFAIASITNTSITRYGDGNSRIPRYFLVIGY